MKTVEMPSECARAAIASRSPPSDFDRYQIHMPLPSNAVPDGVGCGPGGTNLTTWIGPNALERRPKRSSTRMRPDFAFGGTTTTRPSLLLRSVEVSGCLARGG